MYYDYNEFGQAYFEGKHVSSPNPAGYSGYGPDQLQFSWYAEKLKTELEAHGVDPAGKKVLVVGCAYGYTVKQLIEEWDVDAYGMDISSWATSNAVSGYSDRIYQGDARSQSQIDTVLSDIGTPDAILTECMLSCLLDSEAQEVTSYLRDRTGVLIHRVWSQDGSDVDPSYYNVKTITDWQSLCDPDDEDYWYMEDEWQP